MRHNPERALGKILNDNEASRSNSAIVTLIANHSKVVDIDDPRNSKRIRVRIEGVDDDIKDENLPWCTSLMPNFFYCLPQIDEYVMVFLMNPWNKGLMRMYMGPFQTGNFGEQDYYDSMTELGFITFEKRS